MGEEQQAGNSVVLFEGNPLERIAADFALALYKPDDRLHPQFFIPKDIVVGDYGVVGLLVVDTRPEARWESYTDGNLYRVTHSIDHCIHLPPAAKEDPVRLAHFVNTDKGFKMIRYFLLPNKVDEFFRQDKHIGEGLIAKCCETGMPEWFDEETAAYVFGGIMGESQGDSLVDSVIQVVAQKLGSVAEPNTFGRRFSHKTHLSFHPWQFYNQVISAGDSSVYQAIGAFDRTLGVLDRKGVLPKRNLNTEGAQEYRIALPPMQ